MREIVQVVTVRRAVPAALLCLLLIALVSPARGQTRETDTSVKLYQQSWAVVIGIDDYQHERVPKLRAAVNDARAIERELLRQGFPRDHVITLLDRQATKSRIERVIVDDLRTKLGPDDRVLIFFAGHGMTDHLRSGEDEGFLLPVDADPSRLYSSAISMTSVRQISDRLPAKHILYIVDACYSGYAVYNRSVAGDLLEEMIRRPAIQILTAGRQQDLAQERANHGLFTQILIRGLQGEAFSGKDWLALEELGLWVKHRVFAESNKQQLPQYGNLYGEGQFVFLKAGSPLMVTPTFSASRPRIREEVWQQFGGLSIKTPIPEVEIWLGNQKIGETKAGQPLLLSNLTVGTYKLIARKSGYKDSDQDVVVKPDARTEVSVNLQPLLGSLGVVSRLDGVEVWVGNQKLGETTAGKILVASSLPIGTYRVKAAKGGHKPWEQDVHVKPDSRTDVQIDLQPLVGSLALTSRIGGVEVWVGNQRLGETRPGQALVANNLGVGGYRVKALKRDHKDWEADVQVRADTRTDVLIDLQPATGSLRIVANVTDVQVWLDDRSIGQTQTDRTIVARDIPVGPHRVKASKSGHKELEREVHVRADTHTDVLIDLPPLMGSLGIGATVSDAQVWLDGQMIGETKAGRIIVASDLPMGPHRLKGTRSGHKDWEQEVQVRPDTRTDVLMSLQPLTGSLAIAANVPGVEVWLDDQSIGETKAGRMIVASDLPMGPHRVKGGKAGHRDWEQEIQVRADTRTDVVITLEPLTGTLAISANVADVEVWLNEQRIGATTPGRALVTAQLPIGDYRVKGRKNGHKEWERQVQVRADTRDDVVIILESLGPPKIIKGDDGGEMMLVSSGEFLMGNDTGGLPDEKPRHRVFLDRFYIDRYETTNALYGRFVTATGRPAPSYSSDRDFNGPKQPVVGVTWRDADAYCRWAGKRLPTEAEWEKAARGVDARDYPWGGQWDPSRANAEERLGKTAEVGAHPAGASIYDVHDLAGNVLEWVADWYAGDYYASSPARNPQGPTSGDLRGVRGGSWLMGPFYLRAASRSGATEDFWGFNVGFRCVKPAP
jgi:sulfatase modifying factor 1